MSDLADQQVLFEHTRRPEWGLAVLTNEDRTHRYFQFQDGELRTIKDGYYHLIVPTQRPAADVDKARAELGELLRKSESRDRVSEKAKSEGKSQISVHDQVTLFKKLFPAGFEDPAYLEKVRGLPAEGGRNGGPDAARAIALELLSEERLRGLLAADGYTEIYEAIISGLQASEIVSSSSDIRPLRRVPDEERPGVCRAFVELLHGPGDIGPRFDAFRTAVDGAEGGRATWPMITVLLGLLYPDAHYCVKPSVFRQQARFLMPETEYEPAPSAAGYQLYKAMADDLRERIVKAGLQPKDNLDVYGFIFETMRPGLKEQYAALGH